MNGLRFDSLEELLEAAASFGGGAFHVLVLHEQGRPCTRAACRCSPSFVLRPATVEALREGAELEAAWAREVAS